MEVDEPPKALRPLVKSPLSPRRRRKKILVAYSCLSPMIKSLLPFVSSLRITHVVMAGSILPSYGLGKWAPPENRSTRKHDAKINSLPARMLWPSKSNSRRSKSRKVGNIKPEVRLPAPAITAGRESYIRVMQAIRRRLN